MKQCNRCYTDKPLEAFSSNKWAKDGLSYQCRECDKVRAKQYYTRNKEKHAARMAEWSRKNKDRIAAHSRQYYLQNKETILYAQRVYRTEQAGAIRARLKEKVDNLADGYIDHMLKRQLGVASVPQELIEAKRNLILVQRELRRKEVPNGTIGTR